MLDGTWWLARSRGAPLPEGRRVRVTGLEGLELIVEPVATDATSELHQEDRS